MAFPNCRRFSTFPFGLFSNRSSKSDKIAYVRIQTKQCIIINSQLVIRKWTQSLHVISLGLSSFRSTCSKSFEILRKKIYKYIVLFSFDRVEQPLN